MTRHERTVYKCNKLSMEVIEVYQSAADAARAHGLDYDSVRKSCREHRVPRKDHVWRYAEDYDPDESFEGRQNRPVVVYDAVSKAVGFFSSTRDAANRLGVKMKTIEAARDKKRYLKNRFVVKYAR